MKTILAAHLMLFIRVLLFFVVLVVITGWTDPYAVKVIDGWAANNAEFEHETVADPWKKSQKFISNG